MKSLKLRAAILLGLSVVVLSVTSTQAIAQAATATPSKAATQTDQNSTTNSANTLTVSPLRSELTIEAGKSGTATVYVTNRTKSPIVLKAIENDFVAGDEKGTPSIILDENSYAPTHSLKRFMVPIGNVTVAAGATQQVDVKITVPKSAQAGGYFGAIRFAPASIDGSKSVNLSASVASLVLMTVPGDLVEQMMLTNFDIQQDGGTANNFRTSKDLQVFIRFKNNGNVQAAPFGQINVLKGGKTVYKTSFNTDDPKASILPDSARRWTVPVKDLGKFGKYTVTGNFTYGTTNQSIEVKKTIWIVPTTYIFGAIAGFIGLMLLAVLIVVSLKSYKKKILKSARRR